MSKKNCAYICPIVFGIVMIIIGLCIKVPGGVLTTRSSLDGDKTYYYTFDDKYSAIDEYVGGDAYNYEIGASLVAGRTAGAMTSRSIFIAGGIICLCFGFTILMLPVKSDGIEKSDLDRLITKMDAIVEKSDLERLMDRINEAVEKINAQDSANGKYKKIETQMPIGVDDEMDASKRKCPKCGRMVWKNRAKCFECGYIFSENN